MAFPILARQICVHLGLAALLILMGCEPPSPAGHTFVLDPYIYTKERGKMMSYQMGFKHYFARIDSIEAVLKEVYQDIPNWNTYLTFHPNGLAEYYAAPYTDASGYVAASDTLLLRGRWRFDPQEGNVVIRSDPRLSRSPDSTNTTVVLTASGSRLYTRSDLRAYVRRD